ncbi:hypothetical protein SAY87_016542 [Trapa incisa]|uniref:Nucleolus and neural progenitor protein-like N-terminal domain-containing protein n=1 Tax=Trapa incisa TaxID=236973 RepID=A0AAN7QXK6_9MYRT|nr:hypothetical protein SAY87_016542 [Trapa incisa]
MGSEVEILEQRLKTIMGQLHSEFSIFERIVHKNKNQHRRCKYFQYLLKVRRDFRLLQSAKLEELMNSCFNAISENNPKQKISLLESLKRRKCDGRRPNFLERLHGVARLLSQAIEPILKAAEQISVVLSQSFFMGFSLTALSLLARMRVLAQQILLDVVSVFNMVTSISQKRQSIKLTQEGTEIFSEYYPIYQDYVILECIWKADKFVLMETAQKIEIESQVQNLDKNGSLAEVQVLYESIEAFLELEDEEHDLIPKVTEINQAGDGCPVLIEKDTTKSLTNATDVNPAEDQEMEDKMAVTQIPDNRLSVNGGSIIPSTLVATSEPKKELARVVAYVSIKRPSSSKPAFLDHRPKKTRREEGRKEDPFFNMLTGGHMRDD